MWHLVLFCLWATASSHLLVVTQNRALSHVGGKFSLIPQVHNSRPCYKGANAHYIYHQVSGNEGKARWVISTQEPQDSLEVAVVAWLDGWALTPVDTEVAAATPRAVWQTRTGDVDTNVDLSIEDRTDATTEATPFHLASEVNRRISGVYVPTGLRREGDEEGPLTKRNIVYVQGGRNLWHDESDFFLFFAVDEGQWIVGEDIRYAQGLAFSPCSTDDPSLCSVDSWRHNQDGWQIDPSIMVTKKGAYGSILQALWAARATPVDSDEAVVAMRHGVTLPLVGLGTGGAMDPRRLESNVRTARKLGYRLFDTARAYNNEGTLGELLRDDRHEVFLTSKIWYSDLGFQPSLGAVRTSLDELQTSYIDLYLIHWPQCYDDISWMECTGEEGDWRGSFLALERLFAEGYLQAVGLSNFDSELIEECTNLSVIAPHVVQNTFDPVSLDTDSYIAAQQHGVLYQGYSSVRSALHAKGQDPKRHGYWESKHAGAFKAAEQVAELVTKRLELRVGPVEVMLRWSVEHGVSVIPSSNNPRHLEANLMILKWELNSAEKRILTNSSPNSRKLAEERFQHQRPSHSGQGNDNQDKAEL